MKQSTERKLFFEIKRILWNDQDSRRIKLQEYLSELKIKYDDWELKVVSDGYLRRQVNANLFRLVSEGQGKKKNHHSGKNAKHYGEKMKGFGEAPIVKKNKKHKGRFISNQFR